MNRMYEGRSAAVTLYRRIHHLPKHLHSASRGHIQLLQTRQLLSNRLYSRVAPRASPPLRDRNCDLITLPRADDRVCATEKNLSTIQKEDDESVNNSPTTAFFFGLLTSNCTRGVHEAIIPPRARLYLTGDGAETASAGPTRAASKYSAPIGEEYGRVNFCLRQIKH